MSKIKYMLHDDLNFSIKNESSKNAENLSSRHIDMDKDYISRKTRLKFETQRWNKFFVFFFILKRHYNVSYVVIYFLLTFITFPYKNFRN